jgi:hypothetical protein
MAKVNQGQRQHVPMTGQQDAIPREGYTNPSIERTRQSCMRYRYGNRAFLLVQADERSGREGRGRDDGVPSLVAALDGHDCAQPPSAHAKINGKRKRRRRTEVHVPGEVADAIERVERERRGEHDLGGHLDGRWHLLNLLDDLLTRKRFGRDEVREREAVEHCVWRGRSVGRHEQKRADEGDKGGATTHRRRGRSRSRGVRWTRARSAAADRW